MPLPTSAEFLELCRSQIALLTQGLGASLSAVYLAEQVAGSLEPQLTPVLVYPDSADAWRPIGRSQSLLVGSSDHEATIDFTPEAFPLTDTPTADGVQPIVLPDLDSVSSLVHVSMLTANATVQPVVIPLVYGTEMVGLLVTGRNDRPWTDHEHLQLEHIARVLAIACLLDRRSHLLGSILQDQQQFKAQQTDLLHNLLHQFRNPLTALKTFGKLLLRRLAPADSNRDLASSIIQESDRLRDLLSQFEQVIDLDRQQDVAPALAAYTDDLPNGSAQQTKLPALPLPFETATNGLAISPCAINDLLLPLLQSAAAMASDRGLSLQVSLGNDLPPLAANATALREVLSNILDNALKYTPSGGEILVQTFLDEASSRVGIAMSDTGPGIPPQDLSHLFERHYRGVQAMTDIPGTGLGLAIAKDLVHQMHGDIQASSPALVNPAVSREHQRDPGAHQGVTFIVWMPTWSKL
ncbi:MAG: GAF domain-containing sensor histidine kinase [Cyanobacteria bacterium]|nr:GAF domain-containing sensor histidine kinase [Cyanobacteriota bacterium]MDW8199741.1 GAF domain-containing sensor histidine kinase [Cyanobacteriota bacterium SKYGB_h_bin112]